MMRLLVVGVILVGLASFAAAEDSELIKRLLDILVERKNKRADVEKREELINTEKRNSQAVRWDGKERKLYIYLLVGGSNCPNPCKFTITFQKNDGKTFGNELTGTFDKDDKSNKGRLAVPEDEIMGPMFKSEAGNGQNAIDGDKSRSLPDILWVRVCRHDVLDGTPVQNCNMREVDTTRDKHLVIYSTVQEKKVKDK